MKNELEQLSPRKFLELGKLRKEAIAAGIGEIYEYPVNRLAKELHPGCQFLKVREVIPHNERCKSYILIPDSSKGTNRLAYFAAGQYLSVFADIEGKQYSRPYSISSSPKESSEGYYRLTIKAADGGMVSNYILDTWQEGTKVTVSDPMGNFTYESLRDEEHIIGIAGGSGITPFLSLAKAIADGEEDCSLTLLYGSRTEKEILFSEELRIIADKCRKVRVVHVLSEEQKAGYEYGFVTAELIRENASEAPYSVFLCGPEQMIQFVDKEIGKLNLEQRQIRHEVHGEVRSPLMFPGYPGNVPENVGITVLMHGRATKIRGNSENTILRTLEQNGLTAPSRCRGGECGFCRSRLISGNVFIPEETDRRRRADAAYGYIHPCCTYPLGDLEMEVFEE